MNRMKFWREKKTTGVSGILKQICVWAPERSAETVKALCERIAEPNERGESLRAGLMRQLKRRRTISAKWWGLDSSLEMDSPCVGPYWFMRNIGGRILGPGKTHIELTPSEIEGLEKRLKIACDQAIKQWLSETHLTGTIRDDTGVVIDVVADHDKRRPADEKQFAENEARIAGEIIKAGEQSRKPPVEDSSIITFEGNDRFPSFCQIAHRKKDGAVQIALIHVLNGGTSPTNAFESLATNVRWRLYPKIEASDIQWFDVCPQSARLARLPDTSMDFCSVKMESKNGVYSSPVWSHYDGDGEWPAFVQRVIDRTRLSDKIRSELDGRTIAPRKMEQPVFQDDGIDPKMAIFNTMSTMMNQERDAVREGEDNNE